MKDKIRVAVVGSNGMQGHITADVLERDPSILVGRFNRNPKPGEFYFDGAPQTLVNWHPDYIINAVGLLVDASNRNPELAVWTNGHLPFLLGANATKIGARVIHLSTDCVFNGKRGAYTTDDAPDASDIYGRTKMLGELRGSPHLTIRTSIIGPELKPHGSGLFHWFMHRDDATDGYSNVFWNGVTTLRLAQIMKNFVLDWKHSGLIHISSDIVSKEILLNIIAKSFGINTPIHPKAVEFSDKTLVPTDGFGQGDLVVQIDELRDYMKYNSIRYPLYKDYL